jgi:hypothetical protein
MSWWQAFWLAPVCGILGSLALISVGAIVIIKQTPSDALFSRYPGSMIEARAFLSAILVISGLVAFFMSLVDLLAS